MGLVEIVELNTEINSLKETERFDTCIPSMRESTAGHTWQVTRLALDVIPELRLFDLNLIETIRLTSDHDLPEYPIKRDINSIEIERGDFSKEYKRAKEERIIKALAEKYGRPDIYERWLDYEYGRTDEAIFVRGLDKIGTMIHMSARGMKTGRDDDKDHNVLYADEAVLAFIRLKPLLKVVKDKIKVQYRVLRLPWKPAYDKV